jgi:carboxymethylproline synthase
MPDSVLLHQQIENVLVLTFNHEKSQNPFSDALQDALMAALKDAETNETVSAVVLYGGRGRSFSVGGDFKEAVELGDPKIIGEALHKVVDLYVAILQFNKPLIAAIDYHAIGMGFQIAILSDYRVATTNTAFLMPELKNGVACTLGCAMTEYLFGRFVMQEICYESNKIPMEKCIAWKLVNEIANEETLLEKAIEKAKFYGSFPQRAFTGTKRTNNKRFITVLEDARQDTVDVHTDVFMNKEHRTHMETILGKNKK